MMAYASQMFRLFRHKFRIFGAKLWRKFLPFKLHLAKQRNFLASLSMEMHTFSKRERKSVNFESLDVSVCSAKTEFH